MTPSDLSIKRPVFTTMLSLLLVVLGLVGASRLGTDLFPNISTPIVSVVTVYPGAGPTEVESQIVQPIEDAVAGITGVETIHGYARENAGVVLAQFTLGTDLDKVLQEVRERVSAITTLPKDIDAPRISRVDIGATPILTYAVNSDLPTPALRSLLKERLEPALGQVAGVAQVRILGGDTREVRVDVDASRAKAAGVAPAQIAQAIGEANVDIPSGRFLLGPRELGVRTLGQFQSLEDLRDLPVARNSKFGTWVPLSSIASVTDGVADRRTVAHLDGAEAVVVEVVKQSGTSTVEVADAVKERMASLTPQMGHRFSAKAIVDSSTLVNEMIKEVWIALSFGGLMAIAIIYLFLLDSRGTAISATALPISVIGTFFAMYALNYTLNLSTLLALSLAIGLLIDDAVVVREAITHRLERGEPRALAASRGTQDVFLAVLATTLSLLAVFIPVAFMPGLAGQFFKQFGFTMSAAVAISLFVSFTLDPMLSARFSKELGKAGEAKDHVVARGMKRALHATDRAYERSLSWTLKHPWWTTAVLLLGIAAAGVSASRLGIDFIPPIDKNFLSVNLTMPEGSSLEQTVARVDEANRIIHELPDVVGVYALAGADPTTQTGDANSATMRVLLKERADRKQGIVAIKSALRDRLTALPATKVTIIDPPIAEGVGQFRPLEVFITGPDLDVLRAQAHRLTSALNGLSDSRGRPLAIDVASVTNPPKPEVAVTIDRPLANAAGVSSASLGGQLRLAMNGAVVGQLREGTRVTDISVRLASVDRATPETLKDMDIFTPKGVRSIGDIATVSFKSSPATIERYNRERAVALFASNAPTASLGQLADAFRAVLAKAGLPPGYSAHFDGQVKVLGEQNAAFVFVFALAFAFVYMVLASQFESFKHPITIMISMPLAAVGAMLALFVGGWSLSLGSMIGLVLLLGLVTKNAILLVDQSLQNLRAGDDVLTALLKAGPRRLRPILMTSGAMAIGMLPTALSRGPGFEFRAPMAVGVIGGVISSTILTLYATPLLFRALERITPRRFKHRGISESVANPQTGDEVP